MYQKKFVKLQILSETLTQLKVKKYNFKLYFSNKKVEVTNQKNEKGDSCFIILIICKKINVLKMEENKMQKCTFQVEIKL